MELPRSLFCIQLAYNLDDKDIVEMYLIEFPAETEACIPIALRHMLDLSTDFLSKDELVKYLTILWQEKNAKNKLAVASREGLIYLIPYLLDRNADIHIYSDYALKMAASNGHTGLPVLAGSDSQASLRSKYKYSCSQ